MTTIAPTLPPNGNPGIVPPWLQHPEPITILPMPDGWQPAPEPPLAFTLVEGRVRFGTVEP